MFLWRKSETSAVPVVKLDTMVQARVDLKNKSTRPQKAATSIPHNSQASKRQTELPYTTIEKERGGGDCVLKNKMKNENKYDSDTLICQMT